MRFLVLKGESEGEFTACFIGGLLGSILVHRKPQTCASTGKRIADMASCRSFG